MAINLAKFREKSSLPLTGFLPRRLSITTIVALILSSLLVWLLYSSNDFKQPEIPVVNQIPEPIVPVKQKHKSAVEETEIVTYHRAQSAGAPTQFDLYIHDPDQDEFTSGEIAERGTWHREMCDVLTQAIEEIRLTKGGKKIKVLDVGANVGYISMWVAGMGDDVRLISVEPHPFHNSLFEKSLNYPGNAALAKRIQLHKVALSTESEAGQTLCMKVHPTNAAMTYIAKAGQASGNDPGKDLPCTHVAVTTMDKILNDGKVKIDLMKIDVEGYEINVFLGAQRSLMRYPPKVIVMEYNYFLLKSIYEKPPMEWVVSMFKKGYREIIDMATNKVMNTEAEIRDYFSEENFLKSVPSSHTDIILKWKGDKNKTMDDIEEEVPKRKPIKETDDKPVRRKKISVVE